jgi:hypothetical protein
LAGCVPGEDAGKAFLQAHSGEHFKSLSSQAIKANNEPLQHLFCPPVSLHTAIIRVDTDTSSGAARQSKP